MEELGRALQEFIRWAEAPPRLEQATLFLSTYVFALIAISLLMILGVMLFVGVRTPMQRGWRSKVIAFNLIVWRSVFLSLTGANGLLQPWALIFWVVTGGFMLDFILNFHATWVKGAFDGKSKWVATSALGIFIVAFFLALRMTKIWS